MTKRQKVWTAIAGTILLLFLLHFVWSGFGEMGWALLIGVGVYFLGKYGQKQAAVRAANDKKLTCPHCQAVGRVTTSDGKTKQGVSGGKATAALFTGGVSMLATGLSRKQLSTFARCGNCGQSWVWQRGK